MIKKTVIYTLIGTTALLLGATMYLRHKLFTSEVPAWTIEIDKHKSKAANEYDIIVVGSGLGGLSSGSLLVKEGYKVLVLEQSDHIGGYASRIDFDGFAAFYGAEDISGAWKNGTVHNFIHQLGYSPEELFIPVARQLVLDGKTIDIPAGPNAFEHVLAQRFPADAHALHAFFEDAKAALNEVYEPSILQTFGIPFTKNEVQKVYSLFNLMTYSRTHAHKVDWLNATFQEKLDQYFTNPSITSLLTSLMGYIGASRKTPALFVLVGTLTYFINGSHYMRGGPQALADLMGRYITEHGGTILCNTPVDKIAVENNQVTAVHAGDKVFKASIVIANVDAKTLYTKLLDPENVPSEFLNTIKGLKIGDSSVLVNLGVDIDLSAFGTFFKNIDKHVYLIIRSNSDPSLAPRGKTSLSILWKADYKEFPQPGSAVYDDYVQHVADQAIKNTESVIPAISKHIVARNVVTPYTFEQTFLMPEGAIYGFDARTPKPFLAKSPIKGLYLASASSKLGGVEAVIMAGIWVRNDVVGWKELARRNKI